MLLTWLTPNLPSLPGVLMGCAPELSAQFITAATGRPRDILNLLPLAPPRPRLDAILTCKQEAKSIILLLASAYGSWGSLFVHVELQALPESGTAK